MRTCRVLLTEGRGTLRTALKACERHMVFVRPNHIVIFDRVRVKDPAHVPVWTLHVVAKPQAAGKTRTVTGKDLTDAVSAPRP